MFALTVMLGILLVTVGLLLRALHHERTRNLDVDLRVARIESRLLAEHMAHTNTKLEKRRWEQAYAAMLGKEQS
jgi:uncharacterized membrane protein